MITIVEATNGITVMTECFDCISLAERGDYKCKPCDETDEARLDVLAWNHRADERLAEGDVIADLGEVPVASDWVGSHTRMSDGRIRDEFSPATYNMVDRCPSSYFLGKHMFDLDDDEGRTKVHMFEVVCPKCNLVYPVRSGCQECK